MKLMWHMFCCFLITLQSAALCANDAQTLAAQFFNIITAGLLFIANENKEEKIKAATVLIASMSAIAQTALKDDDPQDTSQIRSFIFAHHKQPELQNEHEQID